MCAVARDLSRKGKRGPWRCSLDIGTNSIGWWLYETDGDRIICVLDCGVRIFSDRHDPKSGASLTVDRRAARSMRQWRDRHLRLMRKLAEARSMPEEPSEAKALEALDPFSLRRRAGSTTTLHHLGRALLHLSQRRGFKSNRSTVQSHPTASGARRAATSSGNPF